MTATDVQQLLAGAPPGATISIISITLPGAGQVRTEMPVEEQAQTSDWTPERVVEWVRQTYGEHGLKLREWSSVLPLLSVRELRRGVKEGWVESHTKSNGKDHGAAMISPDAMLKYLQHRCNLFPAHAASSE